MRLFFILFFTTSSTSFCLSQEKKEIDTLTTARDYFIKGNEYLKLNIIDSSYFYYNKAIKLYTLKNDSLQVAKLLYNKSKLAYHQKDYYRSSENIINALIIFKNINDSTRIFNSYNFLGLLNKSQGLLDESIVYHNKAFSMAKMFKNKKKQIVSLNNIGVTYKEMKDYKNALSFFEKAIVKDSLSEKYPSKYARILHNKAYCNFKLNKTKNVLQDFYKARKIRIEIGDISGEIQSNLNLTEYFKSINNISEAILYSNRALILATKTGETESILDALLVASEIDKKNAVTHLAKYIQINDSVTKQQLAYRNQFSIIEFETEEKERQNLQLQNENASKQLQIEKENIRKWIFGLGLLIVLIIAFFIWRKYRAEARAKRTISIQKNEIENQKNVVENLQRELHHRLKNNLTLIDVFIGLAKGKFKDNAYQEKLNELQNRIVSMFEVHKQLFQKEDVSLVNAKAYIETLTNGIKKAYQQPNITLDHIISKQEQIHAKISFPVGLMVNEFVTNTYKYAFPNNEKGIITIELSSDKNHYYLNLSDNGIGLPKDFDIDALNSFGMETIKLLSQEYDGKFKLQGNNGVRINIILPKQTNQASP